MGDVTRKWFFGACVLLIAGAASPQPQFSSLASTVLTDKGAYSLLPPIAVSMSGTETWAWSPNGEHLVVVRKETVVNEAAMRRAMESKTPPPAAVVVLSWSTSTQKSIELARFPSAPREVQIEWLSDSQTVLIETTEIGTDGEPSRTRLYRTSRATRTPVLVFDTARTSVSFLFVRPSPTLPIALINLHMSGGQQARVEVPPELRLLGATGPIGPALSNTGYFDQWSEDGTRAALLVPASRPRDGIRQVLDVRTGKFETLGDFKPFRAVEKSRELGLTLEEGLTQASLAKSGVRLPGLWLTFKGVSAQPAALVAPAVETANHGIAPNLESVAYVTNEVLFVRPIMKLSTQEFELLVVAAERTRLLSDAKQVSTSIQMFLADNDDEFPDPTRFTQQIMPYIKNEWIVSQFTYTFRGNLADIKDPSKTEIGYIDGPGGRAVAYADGSARWIKN